MKEKKTLGFAMCGSFCTLSKAIDILESLCDDYEIIPIMSPITYATDTRFGKASDFRTRVEKCCGHGILHTVEQVEPIGPKALTDIMVIAPCTGNTLAKLANGITDTSVTMAAKAHLRNERPLVIALATNDALSGSAKNIGALMDKKNVYFVPFCQDDPINKTRSAIANMQAIPKSLENALAGLQTPKIIY